VLKFTVDHIGASDRGYIPCNVSETKHGRQKDNYVLPHACVARPRTEAGSKGGASDDNVDFSPLAPVPVGGEDLRRIVEGRLPPPRGATCELG